MPWHPDPHHDCCCLSCIAVHILFLLVQMHSMSDGVFIQLVNLMVIHINARGFVCVVIVNSPHYSNKDHVELDFLYPCLCRLEISTLCCVFAF